MDSEPLVKVVVTSYNRRDWLQEAVESVLAQTHANVHTVIVDDASTDGSAELAHTYGARSPQAVTVVAKSANRGLPDSIRRGIRAGPEAPFVAFLNEDDRWLPNKIERQIEVMLTEAGVGLVCAEGELIGHDGKPLGLSYSSFVGHPVATDLVNVFDMPHVCPPSLLVTREVSEFALKTMDHYLMITAASLARIVKVDEVLCQYRVSPGAMHDDVARIFKAITLAREAAVTCNPRVVDCLGGGRQAKHELGLLTLKAAVIMLYVPAWRAYSWQAWRLARQRQWWRFTQLPVVTVRAMAARARSTAASEPT
jgi:glycosyltransferase involved in cell wall biosynthesis